MDPYVRVGVEISLVKDILNGEFKGIIKSWRDFVDFFVVVEE